ncbi:hypothetical protein XANCAGTX0491_002494 [Xanthoria calcicola]
MRLSRLFSVAFARQLRATTAERDTAFDTGLVILKQQLEMISRGVVNKMNHSILHPNGEGASEDRRIHKSHEVPRTPSSILDHRASNSSSRLSPAIAAKIPESFI